VSEAIYYICDGCGQGAIGTKNESTAYGPDWLRPPGWSEMEVGGNKKHACNPTCVTKIVMGEKPRVEKPRDDRPESIIQGVREDIFKLVQGSPDGVSLVRVILKVPHSREVDLNALIEAGRVWKCQEATEHGAVAYRYRAT